VGAADICACNKNGSEPITKPRGTPCNAYNTTNTNIFWASTRHDADGGGATDGATATTGTEGTCDNVTGNG